MKKEDFKATTTKEKVGVWAVYICFLIGVYTVTMQLTLLIYYGIEKLIRHFKIKRDAKNIEEAEE